MSLRLGCIADDFTGATDLANNLVRSGLRVVQTIGTPPLLSLEGVDAVVVALKSRTAPFGKAVNESLEALAWLQARGAKQIYFKICSTFDSTHLGNIGPVTEALMDALGCDLCVVTPAFPENGRTVFKGHLFVGDVLLCDSSMRDHPLTPMRDANLVRVMQAQSKRKVGLIDHATVAHGKEAIVQRMLELCAQGFGLAIADALSNDDLRHLGAALTSAKLMTAGSGLATGLAANFGGQLSPQSAELSTARGFRAVVSGSCSHATNRQVLAFLNAGLPALFIDPLRIAAGVDVIQEALSWAKPHLSDNRAILVYSSADPTAVQVVQARLGMQDASVMVEHALAHIAVGLVTLGVGQLVVAGGETSGACVQALGIQSMLIGPQITPGVPWCYSTCALAPEGLHIALKSGNFGDDVFFTHAFDVLGLPHD